MLPDPFTTNDGDVILRAGPEPDSKHDFRAHKMVLSLASPIFRNLFQTAQPDGGQEGLLPTIPITDSPESVDLLLRFIYPGVAPPDIADLSSLSALLTIADKYDVPTALPVAKKMLADEKVLGDDPFGAFIIASRWGFANEAKGAARRLTLTKIMKSPGHHRDLSKEELLRLLWFMQQRRDDAKKIIRTHLLSENEDPELGSVSCGLHNNSDTREFYEVLAKAVVRKFDINPCLDTEWVVMALVTAVDLPWTGKFCEGIDPDPDPEREDFYTYCPLRPSVIVNRLNDLAIKLGVSCEQHLRKAFGRKYPPY